MTEQGDSSPFVNVFACAYVLLFLRRGIGSLCFVDVKRYAPGAIMRSVKLTGVIRA